MTRTSPSKQLERQSNEDLTENETPLMNPLAFHNYDWIHGSRGRLGKTIIRHCKGSRLISPSVFMGTSSNWSFNRRVLAMAHESVIGSPLPSENLHFDGKSGKVYDLQWDGNRRCNPQETLDSSILPTQDFAIYLINSVKYHCGWLYHLFEETPFMEHFKRFHECQSDYSQIEPLWFVHYLLILAFGKAFVVRSVKKRRPPGADLFVLALKLMPDFTLFDGDAVEQVQILCCTALYLRCIDYRMGAWRYVSFCL